MISAGDLQQARARARIRNVRVAPRSICRRESGTALVHNKPPLFPPYFLFLFFLFFLFFFFVCCRRRLGYAVIESENHRPLFSANHTRAPRARVRPV